jgi:hypothetical protein
MRAFKSFLGVIKVSVFGDYPSNLGRRSIGVLEYWINGKIRQRGFHGCNPNTPLLQNSLTP